MLPATTERHLPSREFAISLFRGELAEAAANLPEDIAAMSELELLELRKPTEKDQLLRDNLWKQVVIAEKSGFSEISITSIYSGICSQQNFSLLMRNPHRLAWLLTYPMDDVERLKAGLNVGVTRLIEFVSKPVTAETAMPFLKALEMMFNRVHGPVVQRIDARHAHLHGRVPAQPSSAPEDVQNRLNELKTKLVGGASEAGQKFSADPAEASVRKA